MDLRGGGDGEIALKGRKPRETLPEEPPWCCWPMRVRAGGGGGGSGRIKGSGAPARKGEGLGRPSSPLSGLFSARLCGPTPRREAEALKGSRRARGAGDWGGAGTPLFSPTGKSGGGGSVWDPS